ncbi:conserved protein of unknown function [Methanocaldococcus lauensis]|uniref:Uncharacterized protein n=1 Tax=Methanocaldococcus lauensis TaxID=2546128 RepID=A0A8D6PVQ7_9EURY|nr:UPF0058 family protein [Methanocaldococcus lauensis]CAB3288991.1 conserved protein of unknown function [Methanocaldococcus lauensis]CAB3289639.1 conserved protein of unknown function [Methanocaldococcus lauensis]
MDKEQLMKLHQFFVYVVKEISEDNNLNKDCDELLKLYEMLDIRPHHIHRLKNEQKAAILLLSAYVAKFLANNLDNVPENLSKKLKENAIKHLIICKKEDILKKIGALENDDVKIEKENEEKIKE